MESVPFLFVDAVHYQLALSPIRPLAQLESRTWNAVYTDHVSNRKEFDLVYKSITGQLQVFVESRADNARISVDEFLLQAKRSKYSRIVEVNSGWRSPSSLGFRMSKKDAQRSLDLLKPHLQAVKTLSVDSLQELLSEDLKELRILWEFPLLSVRFADGNSTRVRNWLSGNDFILQQISAQMEFYSAGLGSSLRSSFRTDHLRGVQRVSQHEFLRFVKQISNLLGVQAYILANQTSKRPLKLKPVAHRLLTHEMSDDFKIRLQKIGFVDAPELLPSYEDERVKNVSKWEHPSGLGTFILGWGRVVSSVKQRMWMI